MNGKKDFSIGRVFQRLNDHLLEIQSEDIQVSFIYPTILCISYVPSAREATMSKIDVVTATQGAYSLSVKKSPLTYRVFEISASSSRRTESSSCSFSACYPRASCRTEACLIMLQQRSL